MIQIYRCAYCPPQVGDVAMISMIWADEDEAPPFYHAVLPIFGGEAQWEWCRQAPLVVQHAFQEVYKKVQDLAENTEGSDPC